MPSRARLVPVVLVLSLLVPALGGAALADEGASSVEERLRALERRVLEQDQEIQRLRTALEEQAAAGVALSDELDRFIAKTEDEAFWQQPGTLRAYFKDGFFLGSPDGSTEFRIGAFVNADFACFDADTTLEEETKEYTAGTEFRRARLYVQGKVYETTTFRVEFDFANGAVAYKDVYFGLTGVPVLGTLSVGHQREPMSLEQLTSTTATTFMELSLADCLVPGRNMGLRADNSALDGRLFWGAGLFFDTDDSATGTMGPVLTARVAGLLYEDAEAKRYFQIGASASHRKPHNETFRFSTRPEAHLAPKIADTEDFEADSAGLGALEAVFVAGPFSVQAEYMLFVADDASGRDPSFSGGYVYASYFLTGESRPLAKSVFAKPKPAEIFPAKGAGAVELAARWSWLDLTAGEVEGGDVKDATVGVNWYLSPLVKVMLNWVHARRRHAGEVDVVEMRFQFDF